jgi:hypothetical protein
MRSILFAFLAIASFAATMTYQPADANAIVCARGVYRAGCVGPYGGVAVRTPYAGVAVRGAHGGAAVRGPYGGVAVRGRYGSVAVRRRQITATDLDGHEAGNDFLTTAGRVAAGPAPGRSRAIGQRYAQ